MLRVVGVEALLDQLSPAERVVVSVDSGRLPAEDADPVPRQHAGPERLLVITSVAALSCTAALGLGLLPVVGAATALVGVLGAARGRADPPSCPSGHRAHLRGSSLWRLSKGVEHE